VANLRVARPSHQALFQRHALFRIGLDEVVNALHLDEANRQLTLKLASLSENRFPPTSKTFVLEIIEFASGPIYLAV
jgi:hypothetical protein